MARARRIGRSTVESLEGRRLMSGSAASLPGDANADGKVDLTDFTILATNVNATSGKTLAQGDFDGNGAVDLTDFTMLAANFNRSVQPDPVVYTPLVVTRGGTYNGNFSSITVQTTEPVVLQDIQGNNP